MLLKKKKSDLESLKLSDIQFLVAIQLDGLNEVKAAEKVLTFLHERTDSVEAQNAQRMKFERLESDLRSNCKDGLLMDFIRYLCNNSVFVDKKHSSAKSFEKSATLKDLAPELDEIKLYTECMKKLLKTRTRDFIVQYTETEMFHRYFVEELIKPEIGKRYRCFHEINEQDKNEMAESACSLFKTVANRNFHSNYDNSTCTPNFYLKNAYYSFFERDARYGPELMKIFNLCGQDNTLSDNKTTSLSLVGISSTSGEMKLDFRDVVSKIQKASQILFVHDHGANCYYDLVTYYKERLIKRLLEKKESKNILSRLVDIETDTTVVSVSRSDNSTVWNKYNWRERYCERIEEVIINGNPNNKTISDLYNDLITLTGTIENKEGRRLFNLEKKANSNGLSNGSIFQILLDGFCALKKLLDYLATIKEKNITIYNVPITAFRDPKYARRFYSLEEYVALESVVTGLIKEVEKSSEMQASVDAFGMKSNDYLYDSFCIPGIKVQAAFKQFLCANPVVNLKNIIEQKAQEARRNSYSEIVMKLRNSYNSLILADINSITAMTGADVFANNDAPISMLEKLKQKLSGIINDLMRHLQSDTSNGARFCAMSFVFTIVSLMREEGHKVIDNSEIVLKLSNDPEDFNSLFSYLEYDESGIKKAGQDLIDAQTEAKRRLLFLKISAKVICDAEPTTVIDFVSLIYAARVNSFYLNKIFETVRVLYDSTGQDDFLVLVRASGYREVLEMPKVIKNRKDITLFIKDKDTKALVPKRTRESETLAVTFNVQSTKMIVASYNNLMSELSVILDYFSMLLQGLLSFEYFHTGFSEIITDDNTSLEKARNIIELSHSLNNTAVTDTLRRSCMFDGLGYLVSKNGRVCTNGVYYHEYGYLVKVAEFVEPEIVPMSQGDVQTLLLYYTRIAV